MSTLQRITRKTSLSSIQLTKRDVEIFKALHRFTVLTTEQIVALVGGGPVNVGKRLRILFDHGYLARPAVQQDMFRYAEKRPLISALGSKGAQYLREVEGYILPPTVNWDRKANSRGGIRGEVKLRHDIGANSVVIALEQALRGIEGLEVCNEAEILKQAPEGTKKASKPFSIPCRYTWTDGAVYERNVIPDGTLAYIDTRHEKPIRAMLFIEYDREMDVRRSNPRDSSILQKIACYSALHLAQTPKQRFGFDYFRVLFVTTGSETHLGTMVEACKDYREGHFKKIPPYPFYFATREDFDMVEIPVSDLWVDGSGRPDRSLV